jgi:hypothetical protein
MSRSKYVRQIRVSLYFNVLLQKQGQAIYRIHLLINFVFSASNTKYLAELVLEWRTMRIHMRHVCLHHTYRNLFLTTPV